MQIAFGAIFGKPMRLKRLMEHQITKIAKKVAGTSLGTGIPLLTPHCSTNGRAGINEPMTTNSQPP
jgi:hypothetical protein